LTQLINLTRSIKEYALRNGADLIGIADVGLLNHSPKITHPKRYLPDAKCGISIGVRINEGIIEALRERSSVFSYFHFVNRRSLILLDNLAHQIANFLEDNGYRSYPIPALYPYDPTELRGGLSHKHIAVAAGLGQIGWNNLLLTPQFGPRQTLTSVITTAPLATDLLYEGTLCDPEECGYKCVACPTGALNKVDKDFFNIGDRVYEHGKHSKWRCVWGCGSFSASLPMPEKEPSLFDLMVGKYREELGKSKRIGLLDENTALGYFYARINKGEVPWCHVACMTNCPIGKRTK
jgi:epoxyqueuosine reductase QueG